MKIGIKTKYYEGACVIEKHRYSNGRLALQLHDPETWENIMTATVNLPDHHLDENRVLIKNWSENEGILEALQQAGVVSETEYLVPTGYVHAHCVEILEPSLREEKHES